jgi:cyclomaltodextrinase
MPAWIDHAIWWHVYPLGFTAAPAYAPPPGAPVEHRFAHLAAWLDYAVELGCNGLLLGPVFASTSHGYDTIDHLLVDPRLGDDSDWDEFVAAAHERGVRVVLDGVFNHVGRDHPRVVRALADGPDSAAGGWVRWRPGPTGVPELEVFEGHGTLVALNHDNPEVADYTTEVMTHWLDRGADGWRLDAAYAVPAAFWQRVLPRVRSVHPDAWVLGEMIHGDYAAYVAESGIDSVTQYELWKALWSSIVDRNLYELAWALKRHDMFAASFLPYTFVGNHDVTRLASTVTDPRHVTHALAVLFFVAGTPSVYAGDEQGFRGVKEQRVGGDDAVRPAFPATPSELAPGGWAVYRAHQRLIGLRRRYPWLAHARLETLHVANEQLVLAATSPDGDRLVLTLNLGDASFSVPVAPAELILDANRFPVSTAPRLEPVVAPHSWAVHH